MIALASDCLLFEMENGETVPFSADMISVELTGESAEKFDTHFVQHAANAVFHYFKHEMGRSSVTVSEFAGALETVLRGFGLQAQTVENPPEKPRVLQSDLRELAQKSGKGCELFFFPRLRDEIRHQLRREPELLHFRGLRGCVKQLAGARRWSSRCQTLHDQIVEFLRTCFSTETRQENCALLVE